MKKASVARFFVAYFLYASISNFVHPVTPAFLQQIHCPDYMFGTAFAAMAFTNFLCSPLWGKLGDRYGYAKMMAFSMIGYGMGQIVFMFATNSWMVLIARMCSGIFGGGNAVASMAYLVSITENDEVKRGKYLAIYGAMMSVCGAVGYLIGGMLGDISIPFTFVTQIIGVCAAGVACMMTLGEPRELDTSVHITAKDVNPITSIMQASKGVSAPLMVFLLTVFLANFANFAHDNNFNYYLRTQLDFPPSGNGIFKAVVGIIAIVANSTINMWLTKHTDTRKSIAVVLGLCSVSLVAMLSVTGVPAFLITALLYYTFSVIFLPLQQVLMARSDGGSSKGAVSALFNAARSLGMMAGPLFAGIAYTNISPTAPFWAAAVGYLLAAGFSIVNQRQFHKLEQEQEEVHV